MCAMHIFTMALSLCVMSPIACAAERDYPIIPHVETQELIAKWIETASPAQIEEHYALLSRLIPLASKNQRRFVQQVIYAHHRREAMNKGVLLGDLFDLCSIGKTHCATALARYLYGEHEPVRELAWQMFMQSFGKGPDYGCGDVSHIVSAIRYDDENVSAPLERAIFEVTPYSAFRFYLKSAAGREVMALLGAEHTLDSALFDRDLRKREQIQAARKREAPPADLPPWKR